MNATFEGPEQPSTPNADPPGWSLWLVYLVFRPTSFFQHYVVRSVPFLTALCAWTYGIAAVADRIDTRTMQASLTGRPTPFDVVLGSWGIYWGTCLALGILSGFLYYHLGGWWFRKRLSFCGASGADAKLARKVYLFATQAYTVPFIVYALWETLHYDSPRAAGMGDDLGGLLVAVCLFWSVYVSYRGACTVFTLRAWPARTWFLILPALLYVLAFGAILAAFFTGWAQKLDTPEVSRPAVIEREAFRLRHPSNWHVDLADEDHDPDRDFGIEPTVADAAMHFWIDDEPLDPADAAAAMADNLEDVYRISGRTAIESWGPHSGSGWRLEGETEGQRIVLTIFCTSVPGGTVRVLEATAADSLETLEPGYALIRGSFEWKRRATEAAERSDSPGGSAE